MGRKIRGGSSKPNSSKYGDTKTIFAARVREIILDDKTNEKEFKDNGEWASIGTIFFTLLQAPNTDTDPFTSAKAKPLFPHQKNYPLLNEVVYIISLPTPKIGKNVDSKSFYYFQSINIWGSNHHNAIPDPILQNSLPPSQKQDYEQTSGGAVRRVTDGGTEIDLGTTFKERLNVKTLQPFEGDIIHEGRWGQSLRFSSTVKDSKIPNSWSTTGENGDPITILRNNQYEDNKDPWIPQTEDINKEGSSIYLTSTQAIPIEVSSKTYKSYSSPPTFPSRFTGEQIILNSGRLVFNSKSDSILLSSKKTINLNSIESINLDSPKTIIQSKEVYLGDKMATEPIILGNKFLTDLSSLLTQIIALSSALQTPIGTPVPFVPNIAIPIPAVNVSSKASAMLQSIEKYKSKVSKTK
jgi:hypothetical protein